MNIAGRLLEWTLRGAAMPLRVLYAFSDAGYLLLRYVVRYRLGVVRCNLREFPRQGRGVAAEC